MKHLLLTSILLLTAVFSVNAQKDPTQMTDKRMDEVSGALTKESTGWKSGGDFGLNLSSFGIRNPRLADGANQFGFGGILNLFANQKGAKSFFENSALLSLSVLRQGGKEQDFIKNGDILRLNSTWGYAIKSDKIFAALDARIESQLLKTYKDGKLDGIVESDLTSQFFSPVSILLAPGIVYKPNTKLTFFVSPAAADLIYVGNEALRAGGRLGNEITEDGTVKSSRLLLGPALRAKYTSNYYNDKIAVNSSLGWNASYLDALNGRILWSNQLNIAIFKGLGLKLLGEIFYDHYTTLAVDDVRTEDNTTLGPTYRGGFFLTYSRLLK